MRLKKKEVLIALALAVGFALLGLEVRYMHQNMLTSEWRAWIPLVCAAVACLGCLISPWLARKGRMALSLWMLVGVVAGGFGFYFHTDGDINRASKLLEFAPRAVPVRVQSGPPALAPLGLSGLSLIGLILMWPTQKSDR